VPFVDVVAAFERERAAWGDDLVDFLFWDSLHPSRYGYRVWAEAVLDAIRAEGLLSEQR